MDQGQTFIGLLAAESDRVIPFLFAALALLLAALLLRHVFPRRLAVTAWIGLAMLTLAAAGFAGEQWQRTEEDFARQALASRIGGLANSVLAPGSTLACLDAMAGQSVESACEEQIFARPQNVAAAVAYTASRLALLQDAPVVKPGDGDSRLARMIARLQRGLTADRFGFVAHVLSTRYGCKIDACAQFGLLSDASVVKINLQAGTYESYVAKYRPHWSQDNASVVARGGPGNKAGTNALASFGANALRDADEQQKPSAHQVKDPIDYPSADEIPAVSIMDPEPASGPLRGAKDAGKEVRRSAAPRETPEQPKKAERAPPLPRSSPKAGSRIAPKAASGHALDLAPPGTGH